MDGGGLAEGGHISRALRCAKLSLQEERAKVCVMWKLDSLNPALLIFHTFSYRK